MVPSVMHCERTHCYRVVMTETPSATRRSRLVWILAAVLALVIVFVVAFVLVQRGQAPGPVPSPTSTGVSTPSPSQSGSANATPTPTAIESPPPEPDARAASFVDALTSGNTAALEQELADPIVVILVATECCGPVSPVEAITNLNYVNPGSGATWNFAIDESTLASYRSGDYGIYFPAQALVGLSSDGYVVSFIPAAAGGVIETLFIGGAAAL
mgnify:CR=1 FL=1